MTDTDNERFRAIVRTSADGIITISADGVITDFHPAAARLTYSKADEVVGQYVKIIVPNHLR